jgi:hypothetical protein
MVLGAIQIGASVSAMLALGEFGLHPVTWTLAGCACAATALSRVLYRGKSHPGDEGG